MSEVIVCNKCSKVSGCIDGFNTDELKKVKKCFDCEDVFVCREAYRKVHDFSKVSKFIKCEDCLADECLA